jgi:hypothetical protein
LTLWNMCLKHDHPYVTAIILVLYHSDIFLSSEFPLVLLEWCMPSEIFQLYGWTNNEPTMNQQHHEFHGEIVITTKMIGQSPRIYLFLLVGFAVLSCWALLWSIVNRSWQYQSWNNSDIRERSARS